MEVLVLYLACLFGMMWLAAFVTWKAMKAKHEGDLMSARARWDARTASLHEATVCESFTTGWLNVLLQHLWPAFLEKQVSALFARRVVVILQRLLQNKGSKVPLKYFSSIELQELSLGSAAPSFSTCKARYYRKQNYLQLELTVDFVTSNMRAALAPRMKGGITGRVKFTKLKINGRVLLGLKLGQAAPGITAINFSFAEAPDIDLEITPLGLKVTDFPGIKAYVKDAIITSISRALVEPKRTFTDFTALYGRLRAEKQGGPGGLLVVTVIAAHGISAPGSAAQDSASLPDCYCEMKAGAEVYRTPVIPSTGSPEWKWQFDCRLPAPIGSQTWSEDLIFTLFDARTLGDPLVVGSCRVLLTDLELQPNALPVEIYLPLLPHSAKIPQAGRLHLGFQLLQRPPGVAASMSAHASGHSRVSNSTLRNANIEAERSAAWQLPSQPAPVREEASQRIKELEQLLAMEHKTRALAEKQFSELVKENKKLVDHVRMNRLVRTLSAPKRLAASVSLTASPRTQRGRPKTEPPLTPAEIASPRDSPVATLSVTKVPGQEDGIWGRASIRRSTSRTGLPRAASPPEPPRVHGEAKAASQVEEVVGESAEGGSEKLADATLPSDTMDRDIQDTMEEEMRSAEESSREGSLRELQKDLEEAAMQMATASQDQAGFHYPKPSSVTLLMKMAKLERRLQTERVRHKAEIEQCRADAAQTEQELISERQRRFFEELRALCEGGKFRIHKAKGVQVRCVWLNIQDKAVMWRLHKLPSHLSAPQHNQRGQPRQRSAELLKDKGPIDISMEKLPKKMYVKQIERVAQGMAMFPSEPRRRPWSGVQQFLGLGGNNSSEPVGSSCKDWGQDEPDPDRCFSIVFTNHTAIHLEVPHDGNGRSRNEWLSAFEDLRTNQLDLDFVLPRKSKR